MKNLTIEMVNGMSYKELQAVAKSVGVKANQKADTLRRLIADGIVAESTAAAPVAPSTDDFFDDEDVDGVEVDEDAGKLFEDKKEETVVKLSVQKHVEVVDGIEVEVIASAPVSKSASEASAPAKSVSASAKVIEFVSGTDLAVHYRVKGEDVIVGWSKDDYRMHIWSARKGSRLTSYASMIKAFAKLSKVHGDVALVVKCLTRIKKKPSRIVLLERQAKAASEASRPQVSPENVSPVKTEEKRYKARGGATVDPQWLSQFRVAFEGKHDRKPTGLEIKAAWDAVRI